MTIGEEFLKEVEGEFENSRRLIERVPSDRGPWKPHERSSALGHLTQLVCWLPKVMSDIVHGVDLEVADGEFVAIVGQYHQDFDGFVELNDHHAVLRLELFDEGDGGGLNFLDFISGRTAHVNH